MVFFLNYLLNQTQLKYLSQFLIYPVIGYIGLKALSILGRLYRIFIRPRKNFVSRYGKDSWVVITGASDGIGGGFSEGFAKLGFNIILIARNEEKLKSLSEDLEKKYKIKTKYLSFDFSKNSEASQYEKAFSEFMKEDISVLINNVGGGFQAPFDQSNIKEEDELINLNIKSQVLMSRLFINSLLNRKNRSAIISLSSIVSVLPPQARYFRYASTKIYNDFFSKGLNDEFKNKIDVLSVKPLYVSTPLTGRKVSFFTISPEECVNGVLNDLGYEEVTFGNWKHKLQAYIFQLFPGFIIKLYRGTPKAKTN